MGLEEPDHGWNERAATLPVRDVPADHRPFNDPKARPLVG
jgi:hypothetical protein